MLDPTLIQQNLASTGVMPYQHIEELRKALEAGQTYNLQDASGGQALRRQSLDGDPQYLWWRDKFAAEIRDGKVRVAHGRESDLIDHIVRGYGLADDKARSYLKRFCGDLYAKRTTR